MASLTLTDAQPARAAPAQDWIRLDGSQIAMFDERGFQFQHRLHDHPLLQLSRIVELARALPEDSVEYNAGTLAVNQDPSSTPRNGLSVEDTLLRIESCKSWMVLKGVQQDPAYAALLDECLDPLAPLLRDRFPGMMMQRAFIFVSSPGATTPYHVDFEHNFLLQIRGQKFFKVFGPQDRTVLPEIARERMVSGGHRNLTYRDEFAGREHAFELLPGDGVHVPLSSPHWVRVGAEASVSFSVTFQTRPSVKTIALHQANHQLREMGLTPTPVGQSPTMDTIKYNAMRIARKLPVVKRRLA
jgi:Cupin-like domain